MKKTRVLWLTNIPSPYRVDFFNEFGKYCDLTVVFEKRESEERDKSWQKFEINNFKAVFLKGIKMGVAEAFCPGVLKFLDRKKYDKFVVTNYSDLTGIAAVFAMRIAHIPYVLEGDGAFAGSGKGLKERIKNLIISEAELCFSTSNQHDEYYKKYNAKKIIRYPFTSIKKNDLLNNFKITGNVDEYKELCSIIYSWDWCNIWKLRNQIRNLEREKLGIKEKNMVLSVGQFVYRKGFDVLIEVAKKLGKDTGVYIIGGTPTEEYLRNANGHANIHFLEFKNKQELGVYYRAADLFVLPTREDVWGLVINEAMAFMLPVVTTDRCIAGTHLVTNNGYIVKSEDVDDFVKKIKTVIEAPRNYSINSFKNIQDYTIEKMTEKHREYLFNYD